MRTAGVAFLAAAAAGAVLTPVIRHLAHRHGVLDHALTSRKIHGRPIPRLGGIAIVLAFYAPLLALYFVSSDVGRRFWASPNLAFGLIGGGLVIALLGIVDDLQGTSAKLKFLVQFAVAAGMYQLGFRIDHLAIPFGPTLELGALAMPFTMLWIAGVINAMNLIDGLDGLAGGVGVIAVATTFVIAAVDGHPLMVLFTAALGGAVLGFLFYNFNPATIFMGDTGSMFLGFILATTSIQTNHKSSATVAIVVPILALGVPIADTLLAMARRAARGVPLFSADRGHIHHRLLDLGLSQRQTVLVLYGVSVLLGIAALVLNYASSASQTWCLLALGLMGYFALRRLGFLDFQRAQEVLDDRRRNLLTRLAIRRVAKALKAARDTEQVWSAVRAAGTVLGATAIGLRLASDHDPYEFSYGFDVAGPDLFRARYNVLVERAGGDTLELGWEDGRTKVDRDTEIAIELLCDALADALERADRPGLFAREPAYAKVIGLR